MSEEERKIFDTEPTLFGKIVLWSMIVISILWVLFIAFYWYIATFMVQAV